MEIFTSAETRVSNTCLFNTAIENIKPVYIMKNLDV